MQEQLRIRLRTLTPLWSGDIDRDSRAAKESGFIGSLRWWYEGILRKYGIDVCDPTRTTGREPCSPPRLCPACTLFGTTGWARRFRIEMDGLSAVPIFFQCSPGVARSNGEWLWTIFGGKEEATCGKRTESVTTEPNGKKKTKVKYEFGVSALWAANSVEAGDSPETSFPRPRVPATRSDYYHCRENRGNRSQDPVRLWPGAGDRARGLLTTGFGRID